MIVYFHAWSQAPPARSLQSFVVMDLGYDSMFPALMDERWDVAFQEHAAVWERVVLSPTVSPPKQQKMKTSRKAFQTDVKHLCMVKTVWLLPRPQWMLCGRNVQRDKNTTEESVSRFWPLLLDMHNSYKHFFLLSINFLERKCVSICCEFVPRLQSTMCPRSSEIKSNSCGG